MELDRKLELLTDILDVEYGFLKPELNLADIEEWDSLSALSFVVMVKDEFGRKISGQQVRSYNTVQDLLDAMEQA